MEEETARKPEKTLRLLKLVEIQRRRDPCILIVKMPLLGTVHDERVMEYWSLHLKN